MSGQRHGRVGITCSSFDLFHAGHVAMLEEAKSHCDWLIAALQSNPQLDRSSKNRPVQGIVERQMQLRGCRFVDEVWVYDTEKELEDLLNILPLDVRIIGEEYRGRPFTGHAICLERGIDIVYNGRRHGYSSSALRQRVYESESAKMPDRIEL